MAFLGTFAAMGKSTSRRSAKYSYGKDFGTVAKSRSRPETRNFSVRHGQKYLAPGREPPYFSGAFFIFAQLRGNRGGVSLTLRITTSRWVTAVPGMA